MEKIKKKTLDDLFQKSERKVEMQIDEMDFRDLDISEYEFAGIWFTGCNFDKMNFDGKYCYGTYFCQSSFKEASLVTSWLAKSNLSYADFSKADLSGAILNRAELEETIFYNANLSYSKLSCDFVKVDMRLANLYKADIQYSTWEEVCVMGTKFENSIGFDKIRLDSINIGAPEDRKIIYGDDARKWILDNMNL